jgi:hypothetical protein
LDAVRIELGVKAVKKVYCTFSGAPYHRTTEIIVHDAPKFGADQVLVYDDKWLEGHPFRQVNKWLWETPQKRLCGWCAWKPLVIMDALSRCERGDVVLYTDADCYPVSPMQVLFNMTSGCGVTLFRCLHFHRRWCKRDCRIVMGQDETLPIDDDAWQGCARFALFECGDWLAEQILMEWLTYSVNPLANTFSPSVLGGELPEFVEHRCEQAILTNLAYKHGVPLMPEADSELGIFLQENDRPDNDRHVTAPVEGSRWRNVPDHWSSR